MKKTLLTNPAFRYIFEVFIIIFSVTISFYIQDVLNEKDRIEIKNKALFGVLKDISGDRFSLNEGLDINKKRRESINYLIDKRIDNNTISSIRRYKSFLGNNSNYETLQSTGAIESIENQELFINLNNYYKFTYQLLVESALNDKDSFLKFIDYTERNYKIDSSSWVNGNFVVYYGNNELKKMANDDIIISQLTNQKQLMGLNDFFHRRGLNQLKLIDSLIKLEIN
jgi:hypothetical protein